jgi:hypothetical protein
MSFTSNGEKIDPSPPLLRQTFALVKRSQCGAIRDSANSALSFYHPERKLLK